MFTKVIYLIFNEGYHASSGRKQTRSDISYEALELISQIVDIPQIRNGNSYALLSLILFSMTRFPARESADGAILDLESQDRKLWDQQLIAGAFQYLRLARQYKSLSAYHIEAGIASIHCTAKSFEETD